MVFLLAVFGMVCWGLAAVFGKIGLDKVNPVVGLTIRTYMSTILLTGFAIYNQVWKQIKFIPSKSWIYIGIEGILATLVGDLAYYAALKNGDVSFVTLIMSCSPLVSITASVLFLNEQITILKLAGAVCILVGIILITR